ncbi:hypothetical protein QEG46_002639 [Stenotrophomonas maltophilia]|nr:hypothetical protein [Stenotrophomonas maltophilia]
MSALRPNNLVMGYTLVEVLLVLGVSSAIAAAGWLLFGPTSVAADVKETQLDFSETANAIERSLGIVGGYSGLSTSLVRTDGLAALRLRQSDGLRNAWGGSVSFWPNTVKRGNDSFLVETRDVPKAACAKLVAAMAGDPAVWDAQVNGENIYLNNKYDPANAATACEQHGGDRVGFVYFSGLASGSSVATPPPILPNAPPSVDPVNPSTPVRPVDGAPDVDDATPGTPGVVPPGLPVALPPAVPTALPAPATPTTPQPSPEVTPIPTAPPVATCIVPSPATRSDTDFNVMGCPAGYLGSQTQTRSRTGAYACPEAWAAPVLTWGAWSAWTTTSNTCAPACVAPSPTSVAITRSASNETQSVACPTGQTGAIAQTRTRTEKGTRTTSWACPAATGSPKSTVTDKWSGTYTYGGWATTSNTCKAAKTYEWKKISHTGDQLIASGPCTTTSTTPRVVPVCSSATEGQTYTYRINRGTCAPVYMPGVSIDTYQCVGQ